jgi:cobaltochelatase CobS
MDTQPIPVDINPLPDSQNGNGSFTVEFLESLPVSGPNSLKRLAMDMAKEKGHAKSWIQTTNKSVLVQYLLTGNLPTSGSLPTTPKQDESTVRFDLASVIAQAIEPLMKHQAETAIDADAVGEIVDYKLGGFLETCEEMMKTALAKVNPVNTFEIKFPDGRMVEAGVQHKQFQQLLTFCIMRLNVYLVGPAASGKTRAAEEVAKALGLEYSSISVCAQTPVSSLFGFMNAAGNYVTTEFRKRFEFGGIFLCDEFDNGNANTGAALNQATANGVCAFPDGMVKKHPDFICIAAGNTYGQGADRQYVGRNQLDAATLDRFAFVDWGYDNALELHITSDLDPKWTKYVQNVRKAVESLKLRHVVSTRAAIYGGMALKAGLSREIVEQTILWKGLSAEEISRVKASITSIN